MDQKIRDYIKPECQVIEVDLEQVIAVSGNSGTEPYDEEDYIW